MAMTEKPAFDGFVVKAALAPPTMTSPSNGSTIPGAVTLKWKSVTGAGTYLYQIDNNMDFSSPEGADGITGKSVEVNHLTAGTYYWHMRTLSKDGTKYSSYGKTWSFTIAAPAAPTVPSPSNNAMVMICTSISWNKPTGAVRYTFQLDDENTFSDPLFVEYVDLPDPSAAPSVTSLGTYYWRVKARDLAANVSDWSSVFSFTVVAPAAPTLTSPANASSSILGLSFNWNKPNGAVMFNFQIDDENTFSDPLVAATTNTSYQTVTPTLPALGTYYWRVQAKDSEGNSSDWSSVYSVTIVAPATPTQSTPSDNANVVGYPYFSWNSVPGAVSYDMEYDSAASMDVDPRTATRNVTYINGILRYIGTTYWHVRATDSLGNHSAWSPVRKMNTVRPGQVVINGPATGTTITGQLKITFATITGADCYQLQFDTVATFNSASLVDVCEDTSPITSKPLAAGLWYWRIRVMDQAGYDGPWSTARTLTFKAPAAPKLSSPANGISVTSINLKWSSVTGAGTYTIQIDNNADFSSPFISQDLLPVPNYIDPLGMLVKGTQYYWRVKGVDAGGNASVWSSAWSFKYK